MVVRKHVAKAVVIEALEMRILDNKSRHLIALLCTYSVHATVSEVLTPY